MQPSVPANSISTNTPARAGGLADGLRAMAASWRTMFAERLAYGGFLGYLASWVAIPLFQIGIVAMIYGRGRPDLLNYAVVALAANACVFSTVYFVGEILDRERIKGTLVGLFLAPCPRLSWLTGFALIGVVESALSAAVALAVGRLFLGVRFDPHWGSLALTLVLFLGGLWGIGLVFSAIGLAIKKANPFSNLVSPFLMLLGGAYYPITLLPEPLRTLAHGLPLGYGMQALADAALRRATPADLAPQLLPLAGFAVALPIAGVLAFRWVERAVRQRGELDLY
jgi:ABC-2 type transport system permease protein